MAAYGLRPHIGTTGGSVRSANMSIPPPNQKVPGPIDHPSSTAMDEITIVSPAPAATMRPSTPVTRAHVTTPARVPPGDQE